jgi:hypothetical protein
LVATAAPAAKSSDSFASGDADPAPVVLARFHRSPGKKPAVHPPVPVHSSAGAPGSGLVDGLVTLGWNVAASRPWPGFGRRAEYLWRYRPTTFSNGPAPLSIPRSASACVKSAVWVCRCGRACVVRVRVHHEHVCWRAMRVQVGARHALCRPRVSHAKSAINAA